MMRTNLIIAHGVMRMNTVIITFNSLLSYNGSGSRMAYVSKCSCLNVGTKHANKTKKHLPSMSRVCFRDIAFVYNPILVSLEL